MNFTLHDDLKLKLSQSLSQTLKELYPENNFELSEIYKMLTPPPKKNMGEMAFGCFILAKELKCSPKALADILSEKINPTELIEMAKGFGPYLNFFIRSENLAAQLIPSINNEAYFQKELTKNAPKTVIEFSQPNTHKEMHVGHMRNLCLGDALIKMNRYASVDTVSTTFPGDVGTHVAKCLWYLEHHNKESAPQTNRGAWLGTLYTKGNNLLEDEKGTPQEEENRKVLTQILKEIESESGKYFDLWKQTREWSIEQMQGVYDWADVSFDHWYWESDVDSDSVKLVKKYFDEGLFIKDDGAIGYDLSEEKLGFCLLLKRDGTGLYATKDIELARRKFEDHKAEKSIYIVDNRQSLHFKQVFSILDKMGFENAKNCEHLQYEMVELTNGAMSSRKGNIVPIQALIEQMVTKIKTDYLSKYADSWSTEEIERTANIVAAGAIKYGMTRVDSNKKIVFDMNEWLKLDGESGPYIQYVYARINSLLQKIELSDNIKYELLTHDLEKTLLLKLSDFNNTIESSLKGSKTHILCSHLYELAKAFNSFYAECSVMKAESQELKIARASLAKATSTQLKKGLSLLGIVAPNKM